MKKRNILEGVGAALLLLLPYYCKYLLPSNLEIYHLRLPVTNLIGGLLVDMLVYSIFATGLLVAMQYLRPPLHRMIEAMFAGFILWNIADFAILVLLSWKYSIVYWGYIRGESAIALPHAATIVIAVAVPLLLGALAYFLPSITQPVVRAVRIALASFAFTAFWIVPILVHLSLVRLPVQITDFTHSSAPTNKSVSRRIVWLLFDELSYDQTYEHRAPDVQLPYFDRLHTGSVSFSNLKPAGYYTDNIIPSLFIGQRIDQIHSTINGELRYWGDAQHQWLAYDPYDTLFALAQRNGWKTGIDGWFNPYCRSLAPVVSACSWEPNLTSIEEFGASEEKSVLANAMVMPSRFLALFRQTITPEASQRQIYRSIMGYAQALIGNSQIRFVFIHIPVPHGPGIYDRHRHMLCSCGTYLDRLVLADDTLGIFMKEIDATPSASQTTVIVSSDHSWRIDMSRYGLDWSAEEERASGGHFDPRPVLLIHFPGQESGSDVQTVLPEMLEHDIIAEMLRGEMNNPEELAAFLAQHNR